jgi:hypothetical protein
MKIKDTKTGILMDIEQLSENNPEFSLSDIYVSFDKKKFLFYIRGDFDGYRLLTYPNLEIIEDENV